MYTKMYLSPRGLFRVWFILQGSSASVSEHAAYSLSFKTGICSLSQSDNLFNCSAKILTFLIFSTFKLLAKKF